MSHTTSDAIEAAVEKDDWPLAQRLLACALESEPDDHWLLTRMSTVHYERRDYQGALAWSRKALAVAPECPLVLWDYGGALDMAGQERRAIQIWKKLLARGALRIANSECGEGKRWAEALLNDCRYRLGLAYLDLGQHANALRYLRAHLAHRRPGQPSLYTLREVRTAIRAAESAPDASTPLHTADASAS
jgi:tetratricopeptide (TPR) repeat protein